MARRKGELSSAGIDREYPHQVAMRSDDAMGWTADDHWAFFRDLAAKVQTRSVIRLEEPGERPVIWRVFCFRDPDHAMLFLARFGGEPFDPKTQRRRGRRDMWQE